MSLSVKPSSEKNMSMLAPRDYSLIAPVYDQIFNKLLSQGHKAIGLMVKKSAPCSQTLKVLEVGVGSGLTLDHLPRNIHYTGIDINQRMLSLAIDKSSRIGQKKIDLLVMDAHRLNFKNDSFDLVVGASVLTAVKDPHKVMREMIRVTKRGGKIALVANTRTDEKTSQLIRRFDPWTKKYLGFRTDMESDFYVNLKGVRLIENKKINNFLGFSFSNFMVFKKL